MAGARFVAVGHHGLRMSSADGNAWSDVQTSKEGEVFRAASYGSGRFVAVGTFGGTGIFSTSSHGAAWEPGSTSAKPVYALRGLGFGREQFLGLGGDPGAVGDSRPFIATTTDGLVWSQPEPVTGKEILRRVAWGNDRFVAVGDRGRRAASSDGRTWTDATGVKAIDTLIDVAFGKGLFVGVGLHGLRMSSVNGIGWSERLVGEEGEHINSVIWTGERFVAVGQGATYFSPDGSAWQRLPNHNAPLIAVFGQGTFVGAAWRGRILTSTDAIEWRESFKGEHHVEALAFGEGGG